jgi:glucose-6-phosphate isomerase
LATIQEFTLNQSYDALVNSSLKALAANNIVGRIWEHDHTVWKPQPTEIINRLDWLESPEAMLHQLPRFEEVTDEIRSGSHSQILLLGMGGSSLAPSVFSKVFGRREGYPEMHVLDSIDSDTVIAAYDKLNLKETLFIVSSKSGGTVETISLLKYFYGKVLESSGHDNAGKQFIAITDPGTDLESIAEKKNFRAKILNEPNIGGRYSVLSHDGLVPAALMGVEVPELLRRALAASANCRLGDGLKENQGATLGAILGEMAKVGRDKATFVTSSRLESFGNWLEQLIAESTGKEGKGILPVVGEPLKSPGAYSNDRLFISFQLQGERDQFKEDALSALQSAGFPVVRLWINDLYDLGGQFFAWEFACAIAGHVMGVNPFDQPNVESAKALARKMLADYEAEGRLFLPKPKFTAEGTAVYGDVEGHSPAAMLANFLKGAAPGSYVAIHAYVQQTDATDRSLLRLRERLTEWLKVATTVGYGPRYLHSTGQLHKGDKGMGLFVQITSDDRNDVLVPDELGSHRFSVSFDVLKEAEALGDREALLSAGRRVIRFHLKRSVADGLDRLTSELDEIIPASRR